MGCCSYLSGHDCIVGANCDENHVVNLWEQEWRIVNIALQKYLQNKWGKIKYQTKLVLTSSLGMKGMRNISGKSTNNPRHNTCSSLHCWILGFLFCLITQLNIKRKSTNGDYSCQYFVQSLLHCIKTSGGYGYCLK